MENELLYFFSTLPQILAAIVALVFIFVFFKLQNIDKETAVICRSFASTLGNNATTIRNWQDLGSGRLFMDKYLSQNFNNISALMFATCDEREIDNKDATVRLRKVADKVYAIELSKLELIKNVKMLSFFSFFVIISSLVVIPFINLINSNFIVTYSFFGAFIIFAIICLLGVYLILSNALKNTN